MTRYSDPHIEPLDDELTWTTKPIPGQLSMLDPDDTPPHGIPRPTPPAPPIPLNIYTTEELVAWGQGQIVESDADSDLVDAIRNELERRGVRLFGRWTR